MEAEITNYQVVLPTQQVLKLFNNKEVIPEVQFLVGYRNILTVNQGAVSWGLIKSKLHCGRAFVFPIEQSEALNVQSFKNNDEFIETVIKIEKNVVRPTFKLSIETVQHLLTDIGGINKINLSILKNAFDSFQQYRSIIDKQVEQKLNVQQTIREIQLEEKISIQFNAKKLSGDALKQLPLASKDTGDWMDKQTVELKVLEY